MQLMAQTGAFEVTVAYQLNMHSFFYYLFFKGMYY